MHSNLPTGINKTETKAHNLSAILQTLLRHEHISRVNLAQVLGVSTATITNLVNELVAQGLVTEEGNVKTNGRPSVGRPQKALQLVYDALYTVGVHIDVGKIYISLSNLQAEPLLEETIEHRLDESSDNILAQVVQVIENIIHASNLPNEQIVGVGVAASGLVDPYTGINVIAPNLNWHDVPIRTYLEDNLKLPVIVENNVRAMALGESMFGIAQDVNALVFIYARIGVGAGLVVGGQLYRGAVAGAGEIGHTTLMIQQNGQTQFATLESLVCEPAILRRAKQLIANKPTSKLAQLAEDDNLSLQIILQASRDGDGATQQMLEERASYMGIALANLVNIINPELIVLGGIFPKDNHILMPHTKTTMRKHAFAHLGEQVQVESSSFGDKAGVVGAVALALDQLFYRPQNQPLRHSTLETQ